MKYILKNFFQNIVRHFETGKKTIKVQQQNDVHYSHYFAGTYAGQNRLSLVQVIQNVVMKEQIFIRVRANGWVSPQSQYMQVTPKNQQNQSYSIVFGGVLG